ncbi:MFS transporter, partial [Polaribacter sp.]|nr:MFS transporter [Polaribacter sp.]
MSSTKKVLVFIVIAQFCCTSLWFAGNGIMDNLVDNFNLEPQAVGYLTSSVQFGFIIGTLLFALLSIVDRFSPSKVFFSSALLGGIFNLGLLIESQNITSLAAFRFFTGFFLAGIYPVGMKIATDYYEKGLGRSLGYLVGALVLGTALPHLLKDILQDISWQSVLIATSTLSFFGGIAILLFVPNGPYRKQSSKINLKASFLIFKNTSFRKAAFGYFGHMWELYTFWTFVPILLTTYATYHNTDSLNISLLSFFIIAVGSLACILGGFLSEKYGELKIASTSLLCSGLCCLLSPIVLLYGNYSIFIVFLLFWSMVVIADSPLFSTLVAKAAPQEEKGTALTIVNCIGFSITIISIQLLSFLQD